MAMRQIGTETNRGEKLFKGQTKLGKTFYRKLLPDGRWVAVTTIR